MIPYLDAIITTNYDLNLEYNLFKNKYDNKKIAIGRNRGYKYSFNGFNIYHIHGDLKQYSNLCLGYIGY